MTLTTASSPRFGCVVVGTGHCVPQQVLSNEEVARASGTDDAWILARTGVKERRVVGASEHTGTLALEASRRALADAHLQAAELDLIIVCTVTGEMMVPSTACLLQHRLGVSGKGIPAFDVAAGCSGFLYGLATAHAHMQLGRTGHILLVGADVLSRITDATDRNTAALLGDGAAAVVLRRTEEAGQGLLYVRTGADGSGHDLLYAPGDYNPVCRLGKGAPGTEHYLRMDGPKVFKVAVNRMRQEVEEALDACGLKPTDIDLLIAHQANQRILDAVGARLSLPAERVFSNIHRYGNTSAASIPLAYDEARRSGCVHPGDVVLMVTFGAGLTWGSAVLRENGSPATA
jgi:3-oxoacyl-[acyl-carrier-protein] synthase-3